MSTLDVGFNNETFNVNIHNGNQNIYPVLASCVLCLYST